MSFRRPDAGLTLAIGVASVAALLACGTPASAKDDGQSSLFDSVMGLIGLETADPRASIDYHERAPLVLPKEQKLRKPVDAEARRSGAWPQDPDVLSLRKAAADARAPHSRSMGNDQTESRVLSPAELRNGRRASIVQPASGPAAYACGEHERRCELVSPDDMRAQGDAFNAGNQQNKGKDKIVAGQEPDRDFLTQPPKGYLRATQTVKATTAAPEQAIDPANPRAFLRQPTKDDE